MAMVHGVFAWLRLHPVSNYFAARLLDQCKVIFKQSKVITSTTDRARLLMHYHDETCHFAAGDAMY